jgi:hypothetical protein
MSSPPTPMSSPDYSDLVDDENSKDELDDMDSDPDPDPEAKLADDDEDDELMMRIITDQDVEECKQADAQLEFLRLQSKRNKRFVKINKKSFRKERIKIENEDPVLRADKCLYLFDSGLYCTYDIRSERTSFCKKHRGSGPTKYKAKGWTLPAKIR